MVQPLQLALGLIRRDGGTQPRDQISADVAESYAEAIAGGAEFPPVTAFYDGSDYWLADGFHRVAAHERLGLAEIAADVRQGVRRDAILYSVSANATHGYRRSNADKRRAVLTLLNDPEWSGWSDREIARRCAVTDPFVGKLRLSANNLQMPRKVERNGTTYTMNTSAIGKTKTTAEENMDCAEAEAPTRRSGAKVFVPEGADIVALCRKGIGMEASGESLDAIAAEIDLAIGTYRIARQIVMLSDRDELSAADKATVHRAIDALLSTLQIAIAWEIAAPVAAKFWGSISRGTRLWGLAERRVANFERSFGIVMQSCLTADEIELPYLSHAHAKQAVSEINRAKRSLAALATRIQEIHE